VSWFMTIDLLGGAHENEVDGNTKGHKGFIQARAL
jgi:hypothetical protein